MNPNQMQREIEPYLINKPLISNQPFEQPDGNAILYLGLFTCIYTKYFPTDDWLKTLVNHTYADCRIKPGVINRGRHKAIDTQEHDDYIGLAAASFFSGYKTPAIEVWLHGKNTGWCFDEGVYDSKNPIIRVLENWYGRFFGVVAHFKLCAGDKLNLFDKLSLITSFLNIGGESGVQLDWLRSCVYLASEERFWAGDKAVQRWQAKVRGKYPNMMGSVFHIYFDKDQALGSEPEHLFARYMLGKF